MFKAKILAWLLGGITVFAATGPLYKSGILLGEPGGSDAITVKSPALSSSYTFTFPNSGGTNNYVMTTNGSGTASWSQVSLTAGVTGTLPIANGGTGQTTASAAFDALSPMTTAGDIIYGGASGTRTRLAAGSSGQFLTSGTTPAWSTNTYPLTATAPAVLVANSNNTITALSGSTGNRLLKTNGTTFSMAQADLTTDVTGALPIANGGSANGSLAVTNGGVIYSDGSKLMNTGAGSSGQILKSTGAGAPAWLTTLPIANGGTNVATLGTSGGVLYYDGSGVANTGLSAGGGTTAYALTHAGTGQVPSWSTALVYGTFSPTLTNGTNTQASTTHAGTYIRVGSVVDFCFTPDWDPTSTGLTLLGISIPFSSTLGASTDATGVCTWTGGTTDGKCLCYADPTNHRVECSMIAVTTSNASTRICIQYVIN